MTKGISGGTHRRLEGMEVSPRGRSKAGRSCYGCRCGAVRDCRGGGNGKR